MRVTLQVTDGPHKGQAFTFAGHDTFLVGRSRRAHLRLPTKDRYFSRVHFLVEVNPPQCRLMDMGSRNGTYVNGQRVETVDLAEGDQIKAGHTVFRLSLAEDAPPAPSISASVDASTSSPPSEQSLAPTMQTCAVKAGRKQPPTQALSGSVTRCDQPEAAPGSSIPPSLPPASMPLPAPAALPAPPPCPVCGAAAVGVAASAGTPHPLDGRLCAECMRRMGGLKQTIPGYRLLREVGRGSMGVVYLAGRDTDGKFVALKTIKPAVASGRPALQRFLREADILRQLEHPNIVRFLDMNSDNGQLWFAMDFVRGTDAGRLLSKEGPLAIPRAIDLISQLLDALEFAHGRGFVHRDIKPGNLLLTRRNGRETVVLADFGLARVYQASQLSGLTVTGATGGTPMFMPPEQITHYRDAKPAADQYAAAMTLYNLLTGQYAFDAPREVKLWIAMILEVDPVPIRTRRPEIPPELADVIHRAMQKEVKDRFPDVRALRLALKKFGP